MDRIREDWAGREGAGLVAGLLVGLLCRGLVDRLLGHTSNADESDGGEWESDDDEACAGPPTHGEHKLVLCVRTDLKMQKGKMAAQAGHATLGAYKAASRGNRAAVKHWERSAQPKIALQIRSRAEAQALDVAARRKGLTTYMVHDAGRTQIAAVSFVFVRAVTVRNSTMLSFEANICLSLTPLACRSHFLLPSLPIPGVLPRSCTVGFSPFLPLSLPFLPRTRTRPYNTSISRGRGV
jgi:peptidyl-tRNA hydrolase, PTH2 family